MADTAVAITAGSGTNVDTRTEATNGNHRQVIVIGDPSTNAGVATVTDAAPSATDYALVVGIHPDSVNANGQGTMATSAPVVIASDQSTLTTQLASSSNIVSGVISTAMTATTSTSLVAAPGASLRNYITTVIVSNGHATVGTDVLLQDGSGGTTLAVVPAAALYGGGVISFNPPLRQPTTNTALYAANVTTGASTKVSAFGFKGA